jgi:hypothetical protein
LRLTGSVRGRGRPHRVAWVGGHWNPRYRVGSPAGRRRPKLVAICAQANRQPVIDRSPSRIGPTWRRVADQFRSTHITVHSYVLVTGVRQRGGTRRQVDTQTATARVVGTRASPVHAGPRYGTRFTDAGTGRCGRRRRCGVHPATTADGPPLPTDRPSRLSARRARLRSVSHSDSENRKGRR